MTAIAPADAPDATSTTTPTAPPSGAGSTIAPAPTGNRWIARLAIVAFALVLFAWPDVIGDPTRTRQWAEYLCYAMVAVGIDIAWGYGGMLALGQGVFFGLGAYCMGMYLSLEQVEPGQLPQFMALYGNQTELPLIWRPFEHLWFAGAAALLVPMLVAGLLGWLVFRRRVRGPYFALLTQATALIFWLLLVGQLTVTAGTNGLTNFGTIFGRSKYEPDTNRFLFALAAAGLLVVLLIGRQLMQSRFGRLLVATRDGEGRVRFLGYDPAVVKTLAFVVAAGMAGLAGALAAPIIGIVAPNQFAVLPSILMITWVAIGGRGTLYGAVLGALIVSWGKTSVSESRPDDWMYIQGLLFVVVVAYAPGGLLGLLRSARELVGRRFSGGRAADGDGGNPPSALTAPVPETFEVAT
ncbi:MAG: urea ABC transporter permease subunit UrtC [Acidimicrobiales bacterium]|nr:urea ABC transporter permease subunit UrtC [Acidimicrobiales bacterium]